MKLASCIVCFWLGVVMGCVWQAETIGNAVHKAQIEAQAVEIDRAAANAYAWGLAACK